MTNDPSLPTNAGAIIPCDRPSYHSVCWAAILAGTVAAIWSFFALLIGLLVTAFAGGCGAQCAVRHAKLQCTTVTTA